MASNEAQRTAELYRRVGEAVHLSQVLELYLTTLIGLVNSQFALDIDAGGLVLQNHRDTMQRLLKRLGQVVTIDEAGQQVLLDALQVRNQVAHSFFIRNAHAFAVQKVFDTTVKTLKADTKKLAMGVAMTEGWWRGLCKARNLDPHSILVRQDYPEPSAPH